jgi:hypothetical protein
MVAQFGGGAHEGAARPVIVGASTRDGRITPEVPAREVGRIVAGGRVVVIKGAFEARAMLEYRDALLRWAAETPPFPHGQSPSAFPEVNYHRVDDGVIKSVCPHVFHQFGFNTVERLEEYVGEPSARVAGALRALQNDVAGTDFPLSLTGLRLKALHYPAGGGFLAEHTHPLEPQRVGLILSLSRVGEDVAEGATCFQTPAGRIDTTRDHDIGDVIIFRYDLPHEVTAVDPRRPLDWQSGAGKWSVVLELRGTHGLSHGRGPQMAS